MASVTIDWGESDLDQRDRRKWLGAWLVDRQGMEGDFFYDGTGGEVTTHEIPDAAVGIRFLSLDCSAQAEARMKKAVPGYYLSRLKAGFSTGILNDICAYTYDIYLVGHKALPDAVVRSALQAIWVNADKLPQFHPGFSEWTKERAVDAEVTLPYHPAAVRFYKDNNAWPATMDAIQQKLLKLNP